MNTDDFSNFDVGNMSEVFQMQEEPVSDFKKAEEESIQYMDKSDDETYQSLLKQRSILESRDMNAIKKYANAVLDNLNNKNTGMLRLRDKNKKLTEENGALKERIRIASLYIGSLAEKVRRLSSERVVLTNGDQAEYQGQIDGLNKTIDILKGRLNETRLMYPDREKLESRYQNMKYERDNLKQKLLNLEESQKLIGDVTQILENAKKAKQYKDELSDISAYSRLLIHQIKRFQNYSKKVSDWVASNMAEQWRYQFLDARDSERTLTELMHDVLSYTDILKNFVDDLIMINPDIDDELILRYHDMDERAARDANKYMDKRKRYYYKSDYSSLTPAPKPIDFEVDKNMADRIEQNAPPETLYDKLKRGYDNVKDYFN